MMLQVSLSRLWRILSTHVGLRELKIFYSSPSNNFIKTHCFL